MQLSFRHKLTAAFAIAVTILLATSVATYRDTRELVRTTELVSRSEHVLGVLDALLVHTSHAESSSRAYLLQGVPEYRTQYEEARRAVSDNQARLDSLTLGDSSLSANSRQLQTEVGRRLSDLARVVSVRDALGPAEATDSRLAADRNSTHDDIRRISRSLSSDERSILADRTAAARRISNRTETILQMTLFLAVILASLGYFMMKNDLLARRAVESALRASEARFRAATDGSMDAFYVLRALRDARGEVMDFEFAELNSRAGALLGHSREFIVGQRLCELIPSTRTDGFFDKYREVMDGGTVLEEEFEVRNPKVNAAWIHHQVVPLRDGVAITSRDVTERRQQEDALRALSLIDELTGLYNRRGFLTLAQQQLKLARRGHRELLLLFIDMDDFKDINDSFGHAAGDIALKRTSAILKKTFRDSDIVGRMGGDEFVVLATDSGATTTEVIMQRLRRELHERNENESFPYLLSFSVGISRFDPKVPPSIEELMAAADSMLYEQKKYKRQTTPA
ncbi:MAG: diguanylate cyclase [Gemmatimonadaceae bacterium]